MFTKYILLFCALVTLAQSKSVSVGLTNESTGLVRLVGSKNVQRNSIPFFKRTDEEIFELEGNNIIKGIAIKDLDEGMAEPSITLGGLGFNNVHIKLKSERGSGYNFQIEIYA
ncbi:probable salivary secreted peptide [Ostrinia furnacalis]|uniref:probable salivary secreted peptide n=1 Tax=Ostrinia furnacalis TaxID=93504 RepID=UPI001038DE12|nr:probable salivary secreted peptide [Ostrinia furnacalis]